MRRKPVFKAEGVAQDCDLIRAGVCSVSACGDDLVHQRGKLSLFVLGQAGERLCVFRQRCLGRGAVQSACPRGQPDPLHPPVACILFPDNEPVTLHAHKSVGHGGLLDVQLFDQLLLGHPIGLPKL